MVREERRIYNSAGGKKKKGKVNKKEAETKKSNTNTCEGDIDKYNNKTVATHNQNSLPYIKKLENQILQYIIGQDEQVRKVITSIYRAKQFSSIKANVLIIGSTGTGKTEIITQIAKRLNVPYTIEDATKYTQEGYYGASVEDMIYNLLENAEFDIERAQKGIIVIDEIDKKSGREEYIGKDVSGVEVLNSLLKIVEGTKMKISNPEDLFGDETIDFNTREITVIFLGAFAGLDKIRDKRLNTQTLGFKCNQTKEVEVQKSRFLKQDLVKYGLPEEFVGRIDTIIEMNKLKKEDLTLILKKSRLSIFKRYKDELKRKGITLSYSEKLYEIIAEKSLALDTGARELSNTVNYIFENIIYEVLANPRRYTKCILSLEIVEDNTKFTLL